MKRPRESAVQASERAEAKVSGKGSASRKAAGVVVLMSVLFS